MKIRYNWLDVVRGFAMIAVVMGHMYFDGNMYVYFFSFQVALFFMISGISYGINKKNEEISIKDFIKIKFKKIIIPYFLLNIFIFPLWFINNIILSGKSFSYILNVILGIFYSNQSVLPMSSYSTWFLTCLFLVSIIFKYLHSKTKNNKLYLTIIILFIGIIGTILPIANIKTSLPWHLQTVLIALVFYYIGYVYIINEKRISKFINKYIKNKYIQSLLILVFLIIGYLLAIKNGKVSMRNSNYHNMFYFYASAIISSFSYIALSKKINKSRVLEFIGTNTLVILTFHRVIMRLFLYLSPVSENFIYNYPFTTGIIIMILIVPIILFVNKYIPFLVAKKRS